MSRVYTAEEKLCAVEYVIVGNKRADLCPGTPGAKRLDVLRAVARDLRVRADLPRSLALGEIERALRKVETDRGPGGTFRIDHLICLAEAMLRHWSFVQQSLESYGAESAE